MVDKIGCKKNNKFLNENGQAVFELILFLPFLMFLYTMYYTVGNSLSASINQQKAVRGYYYALVKGNSYINNLADLKNFKQNSAITRVGFSAIGWNQHLEQSISYAPCFKFSSLLKNNSTEECDGDTRDGETSSRYIRLFTFYGVCGARYTPTPEDQSYFDIDPRNQAVTDSCTNGN